MSILDELEIVEEPSKKTSVLDELEIVETPEVPKAALVEGESIVIQEDDPTLLTPEVETFQEPLPKDDTFDPPEGRFGNRNPRELEPIFNYESARELSGFRGFSDVTLAEGGQAAQDLWIGAATLLNLAGFKIPGAILGELGYKIPEPTTTQGQLIKGAAGAVGTAIGPFAAASKITSAIPKAIPVLTNVPAGSRLGAAITNTASHALNFAIADAIGSVNAGLAERTQGFYEGAKSGGILSLNQFVPTKVARGVATSLGMGGYAWAQGASPEEIAFNGAFGWLIGSGSPSATDTFIKARIAKSGLLEGLGGRDGIELLSQADDILKTINSRKLKSGMTADDAWVVMGGTNQKVQNNINFEAYKATPVTPKAIKAAGSLKALKTKALKKWRLEKLDSMTEVVKNFIRSPLFEVSEDLSVISVRDLFKPKLNTTGLSRKVNTKLIRQTLEKLPNAQLKKLELAIAETYAAPAPQVFPLSTERNPRLLNPGSVGKKMVRATMDAWGNTFGTGLASLERGRFGELFLDEGSLTTNFFRSSTQARVEQYLRYEYLRRIKQVIGSGEGIARDGAYYMDGTTRVESIPGSTIQKKFSRKKLNNMVHSFRDKVAMSEPEYRALALQVTGKDSAKDMTTAELGKFAVELGRVGGLDAPVGLTRNVKRVDDAVILQKYGREKLDALKQLRKYYDIELDRINAVNKHIGQPQIPRRQDYFTHTMEVLKKNPLTEPILAESVKRNPVRDFPYGKPRTGQSGWIPNLWAGVESYMVAATTYGNNSSIISAERQLAFLKKMQNYRAALAKKGKTLPEPYAQYQDWDLHSMQNTLSTYLRTYTNTKGKANTLGMQFLDGFNGAVKKAVERIPGIKNKPEVAKRFQIENHQQLVNSFISVHHAAMLGLRADVAIRNAAQPILTMLYTSPRDLIKAIATSKTKAGRARQAKNEVLFGRESTYAEIAAENTSPMAGELLNKSLFLHRGADKHNVQVSFEAGYQWAKRTKGLGEADALKWANRIAAKTQFIYGQSNRGPLSDFFGTSRSLGRVASIYTSWPRNFAEAMITSAQMDGGKKLGKYMVAATLAGYAGKYYGVNVDAYTGMEALESLPGITTFQEPVVLTSPIPIPLAAKELKQLLDGDKELADLFFYLDKDKLK